MSDDLGKSVRDRLLHTDQVTAIVGPRIYADVLEQGPDDKILPAAVVFLGSTSPEEDLNSTNRLGGSQVNIWTFAVDRATANAAAKAIRDYALAADLRGEVEGMNFLDVSLGSGPIENVDRPLDGSDRWRKVTQQTFTIWASPL